MIFNQPYTRQSFSSFLHEFLPEDYKENEKDIAEIASCKTITQARELGYSDSLDVYVLEMTHQKDTDPRVAVATDAFRILANYGIDKALVIFKNDNSTNYRFSYLTISLDLNNKNKVVRKYSNARRYSFYLGTGAKVKTPEQQLIKRGRVKDVYDLLSRFSVEVVNSNFYDNVYAYFISLVGSEDVVLKKSELETVSRVTEVSFLYKDNFGSHYKVQAVMELPSQNQNLKSFAVRLIGRAVFCWFLKQKKTENGQLVPDELLSSAAVTDNYYHTTLEPLFFGILNTNIENRDIRSALFDKVPYLNGGLFTPQHDDFYVLDRDTFASKFINTLKIKDIWFKDFFTLLETYNFTIDENTVFDQELSVDPEMLGRIFENLLAEINPETGNSERKRTGSFYTPRQIVEYMVDQSLIEYLKSKTSIDEDKLKALVSYDLTDDTDHLLEFAERIEVINALDTLKILDPACGSGAFPIGALQKIVFILQQVDPDCALWVGKKLEGVPEMYKQKIISESKNFDYTRKRDVIKNTIFGIDIQPIAVDVSRLRCFLTLVVESEIDDTKPNRGIEALPNLDFKFVCANSLIAAPEQDVMSDTSLFGDVFQESLASAVDKYFSSSGENKRSANNEIHKLIDGKVEEKLTHLTGLVSYNGDKKIEEILSKMNKKQIDQHSRILTLWASYKNIFENKPVDFFGIKYFFPAVKDGFDIVIGNPPYVGEKGNKDTFRNIKNSPLGEKFHLGKMDLFYFFFHFGIDVLKDNGTLSYITTNYFITATGAKKLISDLRERTTILRMVNFGEMKIFESALGQHNMITIVKKGQYPINAQTVITNRSGYLKNSDEVIQDILSLKDPETRYADIAQDQLFSNGNIQLSQNSIDSVLTRIAAESTTLIDVAGISQGVLSGADTLTDKHLKLYGDLGKKGDGIFVLNLENARDKEFFDSIPEIEKSILKPFYKNSDIGKYYTKKQPTKFIFYVDKNLDISKFPCSLRHLERFKKILSEKRETKQGKLPWYCLHWSRNENIFTQNKIVVPYRSETNTFSFIDTPWYFRTDAYSIIPNQFNILTLLGILSSRLIYSWLKVKGKNKGEVLELFYDPLSKIPIPRLNNEVKRKIATEIEALTSHIVSQKKENPDADTTHIERDIDELVMTLYDLTEEEKEIVRKS